jgi:hypothetical protein
MESFNWGYVFSTLIIRFIGVFIVLAILQIGITIASKIIYYFEHLPTSKESSKKERRQKKKP